MRGKAAELGIAPPGYPDIIKRLMIWLGNKKHLRENAKRNDRYALNARSINIRLPRFEVLAF